MSNAQHEYNTRRNKTDVLTTIAPTPQGGRVVNHSRRSTARSFDLASLDAAELSHFVKTVCENGDVVCFTLTSDGGALSTVVKQGDIRHKTHSRNPDHALANWTAMLDALY